MGRAELNEIAGELGTSARMLIHHFGSKDELIAAAVAEGRGRQRRLFEDWLDRHPTGTVADLLQTLWELIQAPEAQPYLRLFSEIYPLAIQQPDRFPGLSAETAVHDWLPRLEAELRAGGAHEDELTALATLALAVQRGLLLDLLGTKQAERVRSAHNALLRLLDDRPLRGGLRPPGCRTSGYPTSTS